MFYYVKKALIDNYANFSGRASRAEYWWNALFGFLLFAIVLPIIGALLSSITQNGNGGFLIFPIGIILSLAFIIPSLALTVRRLHDTGKSGWYYFIILIPCGIGLIWWFILMITESDHGPNAYGEEPED